MRNVVTWVVLFFIAVLLAGGVGYYVQQADSHGAGPNAVVYSGKLEMSQQAFYDFKHWIAVNHAKLLSFKVANSKTEPITVEFSLVVPAGITCPYGVAKDTSYTSSNVLMWSGGAFVAVMAFGYILVNLKPVSRGSSRSGGKSVGGGWTLGRH